MRLIKRYSNRKLYDTVAKSYVTLDQIESMIKDNEKIQILENDTNEDITVIALSQIICEQTRRGTVYSPALFVRMIRKGGESMYDYLRKALQIVGDTLYLVEEEAEKKIRSLVSTGEITEEEGEQISQDLEKQRGERMRRLESHVETMITPLLGKLNIPLKSDLERLSRSLEVLSQQVAAMEKQHEVQHLNEQSHSQETKSAP